MDVRGFEPIVVPGSGAGRGRTTAGDASDTAAPAAAALRLGERPVTGVVTRCTGNCTSVVLMTSRRADIRRRD